MDGTVGIQFETSRFGTIAIDPNEIITFTQPILGFQEYRRFLLLPGPAPFLKWLQSTDSGQLAFIVMDPSVTVRDYKVELSAQDLAELAAVSPEEVEVYTLVVVPPDPSQVRTNLKAPIVLNPKHRLAKQVVLDSDYPIQFFLAREGAHREVSDAGTDA